jgi:chromosome segregation ATPase
VDLTSFGSLLAATTIGFGLSLATLVIARRSGMAPVQASLIDTLQDNAAALTQRVAQLEAEVHRERTDREGLEVEVRRLRDALADLAAENAELRRRLA